MISLADLQRGIEAGSLSPDTAIAHAGGDRARKGVHAFVRHGQVAKAQASGPLRGIAVGIKDIIDTAISRRDGLGDLSGLQRVATRPVVMMLSGPAHHHRQDHDHGVRLARSDPDAQSAHVGHTPGGSSSVRRSVGAA